MRFISCFLSVIVAACLLVGQQQTPDTSSSARNDAYSVVFVSSALQLMKTGGSSIESKKYWSLAQLGDAVSVAVLKFYDRCELIKSGKARAYLTVVRNAFSDGTSVLEKSDTNPKVTLFLLDYLEEKEVSNHAIDMRVAYMKQCAKDFTCPSQGEYLFFTINNSPNLVLSRAAGN